MAVYDDYLANRAGIQRKQAAMGGGMPMLGSPGPNAPPLSLSGGGGTNTFSSDPNAPDTGAPVPNANAAPPTPGRQQDTPWGGGQTMNGPMTPPSGGAPPPPQMPPTFMPMQDPMTDQQSTSTWTPSPIQRKTPDGALGTLGWQTTTGMPGASDQDLYGARQQSLSDILAKLFGIANQTPPQF